MKEFVKRHKAALISPVLALTGVCALSVRIQVVSKNSKGVPNGFFAAMQAAFSGENSIVFLTLFAALAFFYYQSSKAAKPAFQPGALALAALFSIFTVLKQSFIALGNWDFIFADVRQFYFALFVTAGWCVFYYTCLRHVFVLLDRGAGTRTLAGRLPLFMEKHLFAAAFVFILVCWPPYIIVFWPGSVPHDGYYQLNMYFGYDLPRNSHPYLSTLLMGWIAGPGRLISDNFGVFLYVLAQSAFCAAVYALVCKKIRGLGLPLWCSLAAAAYFGIVPMWGAYAQAVIKDTLYYALFALFGVSLTGLIRERAFQSIKQAALFTLLITVLCLDRHEAILIVLPSCAALFLIHGRHKRRLTAALLSMLAGFVSFNYALLPAIGVRSASPAEPLSVPMFQTARYAAEYGDELSQDEIAVIDRIFDYDKLAESYDPERVDSVKALLRRPSGDEVKDFVKLWFRLFLRRPGLFVEAALHKSFGYYSANYVYKGMGAYQFYIKGEPIATGDLDFHYVAGDGIRKLLSDYAVLWRSVPVLTHLSDPGSYTWAAMILFAQMLRKKCRAELIAFIPVFIQTGICVFSPVNGLLRYAMPVMAYTPLLIAFCIAPQKNGIGTAEDANAGAPGDRLLDTRQRMHPQSHHQIKIQAPAGRNNWRSGL